MLGFPGPHSQKNLIHWFAIAQNGKGLFHFDWEVTWPGLLDTLHYQLLSALKIDSFTLNY